jgi:hypothetical protein
LHVAWAAAVTGAPAEVIAILRRSYQKKGAKEPIHMVSASVARAQKLIDKKGRLRARL